MMTREELIQNRELLTDKAIGSLCGLAIGDSLGDAARMPENQRDYGFITDFNRGACWSTDDTEFALMVAGTIIEKKGEFTSEDVVKMWLAHVALLGYTVRVIRKRRLTWQKPTPASAIMQTVSGVHRR